VNNILITLFTLGANSTHTAAVAVQGLNLIPLFIFAALIEVIKSLRIRSHKATCIKFCKNNLH